MAHADTDTGPVLPIDTESVHLHVIVDHQIIESIFNNRTAIVSYVDPSKMDATSFSVVSAFGTKDATGVSVHLETWSLGGVME